MSEFSANISHLRAQMGLSRASLAEKLGVSPDKIKHVETGHQRADHELLFALRTRLGVDLNALIGGDTSGQILPMSSERDPDFVSVRRFSVEVAAGEGALVQDEDCTGFYAFNRKWLARRNLSPASLVVVAVRGDSMEPRLSSGDLILVDRAQSQISDGLAYVIRIDNDLMVKNVQRIRPGIVALISANTFYPPREVNLSELDGQLEVIGRVVASMHEW